MTRIASVALSALAASAFLLTGAASPSRAPLPHLSRAANMHDRRADHTATLLNDGRVLIVGGMVENGVFLNSAEIYDPARAAFVAAGSMNSRRVGHSATLLASGKILIAGGLAGRVFEGGPGIVATTEIYDPATGRFTPGPNMTMPRTGQGALRLGDGKVLMVGGADRNEHPLASCEIYDPNTNRFTTTGSMLTPRAGRSAVLLHDGRVLVTGSGEGNTSASAEVYDPAAGRWQAVGDMNVPRGKHAATVLKDGRVLITGGASDAGWHPLRSAEIFDPRSNRFTVLPEMQLARFKIPNAAVTLKNGDALIAGGAVEVEVYDPAANSFARAGSMDAPHFFPVATLLSDGCVLITGGYGLPNGRANGPLSTDDAWIFWP